MFLPACPRAEVCVEHRRTCGGLHI